MHQYLLKLCPMVHFEWGDAAVRVLVQVQVQAREHHGESLSDEMCQEGHRRCAKRSRRVSRVTGVCKWGVQVGSKWGVPGGCKWGVPGGCQDLAEAKLRGSTTALSSAS